MSGTVFKTSLALSLDGKLLFSESEDQTIKVWDVEAELATPAATRRRQAQGGEKNDAGKPRRQQNLCHP